MFGFQQIGRQSPGYPARLEILGREAPAELHMVGNPAALNQPLIGLLCSRQLPIGMADRVREWGEIARELRLGVIGGFLSPAERACLEILLDGTQPVVVCLARGLGATRVPARWRTPLERGRLLLVSPFADDVRYVTESTAQLRNRMVAAMAHRLVMPHAAPGGQLLRLARRAIRAGIPVHAFDHPANRPLLRAGARF
jgi:predicted Rossmann fold nucleotide-binding protein DprA/Smf involved in DNA uptake